MRTGLEPSPIPTLANALALLVPRVQAAVGSDVVKDAPKARRQSQEHRANCYVRGHDNAPFVADTSR